MAWEGAYRLPWDVPELDVERGEVIARCWPTACTVSMPATSEWVFIPPSLDDPPTEPWAGSAAAVEE